MNSHKRLTIGLITNRIHARVFEDQWQGVAEAARKMGVDLIIYPGSALNSPYGFERQGNILFESVIETSFFDGLIIWTGALDWFVSEDELISFLQRFAGIPTVSIETPLPDIPTISVGNYQGMWDLVQHLLVVHDYRRIAFVTGPEGHGGVTKRYEAYCDCLAAHDISFDPELIVAGDFSTYSGKTAVSILIDERKQDFDAIVTVNDKMAVGALAELQARGFIVPQHKAVVGFDDDQTTSPPLTTVYLPFFEMGQLALETCVSLVRELPVPEFVEMPAQLTVRRSCGCLPQGLEDAWTVLLPAESDASSVHQEVITAVIDTIPHSPPYEVLETLALAFERSIVENKFEIFLSQFDKILLQDVANNKRLNQWHEVISIFRIASKRYWESGQQASQAEDLYHQARLLIVDTQRWTYEYEVVLTQKMASKLRGIGDSLITAFGLDEVKHLIVDKFPKVGVRQCAVALYQAQNDETAPVKSELLVVYDENGRYALPSASIWKFKESVLPPMLLDQTTSQVFIVAPLYFREENLGVVVFGVDTKDGMVYETLRMQLSNALKRGLMTQDIQMAQNELELRVAERTSELVREISKHKKTAQALQKSEATTRALLEAIPDAIFLVDENARFLNFMPTEGMKTAVALDDYLGLTLKDVFPPELAQKFAKAIPEAAYTDTVLLQEYMIDFGYENRYYEVRLLGIGEGNVLGIIRDITERKHSETEREQLITELETKNSELERFTYTVSHDLKSPLVTIRGFIGFLESDIAQQNWESVSGDINHIRQASEKMQTLLQDLLDLSRLGRIVNEMERVPFQEIVNEVLLNLSFQYEERGIKLIVPEVMPEVLVDRLRMQEVVQNLLENAAKFMGDQAHPVVEVGSVQRDDDCLFFVKDNGMGLDVRYHEIAFDLFERLHPEVEGTGVGLALVKRIIQLHNGRIWVESPGKGLGSTFFFTLPLPEQSNLK